MHKGKLILLLLPLLALISCSAEHSKIIVAQFDDHQINMGEFENAYLKNSGGDKAPKDSLKALQDFLDLYVNYKMKLRDAEVRGYPDDADMKKEYEDYKIKIGSSLVLNKYLYEPNLKKLYDRRKTEYRASHIFLKEDSTMNTEKVKELGAELIKRINNGEDFAKLAKEYSKDTYSKNRGGDVYYFTAGQITSRPIEDAVYSTEPGHIYPTLVKSAFGYHIIKVTEKHPRIPSIKVAHILIRVKDFKNSEDTLKAYKQIEDIQQQIVKGANFGDMAKKYSDDKATGVNGGELGFIERGKTVQPFDEVAFKLKPGEMSGIVKSPFGYHLIKCEEIGETPSFESQMDELKNIYNRTYYKDDYQTLTEQFKKEMNYTYNTSAVNKILADADTTKINDDYAKSNLHKVDGDSVLFRLNNKPFVMDSLFAFMKKDVMFRNKKIDQKILADGIKNYSEVESVNEKASTFDKEDSEFAKVLDEYRKGQYLFKILDDEVWSKISLDSVKLKNFYDQTKDNYKWKERVEFKEIFVPKDSLINECYAMVASGFNFDSAKVKFNQRFRDNAKPGYSGLVEVDANDLAKQAGELKNVGDISKPFKFENGWSIVQLVKRVPPETKTYDEAKPEVASALQDKESKDLEKKYLDNLKSIYHPKLYYDELRYAFKPSK